jgi:hypothetical protein
MRVIEKLGERSPFSLACYVLHDCCCIDGPINRYPAIPGPGCPSLVCGLEQNWSKLECSSAPVPPYRGRSNWTGALATGARADWSSGGQQGTTRLVFVAVRPLIPQARSRSRLVRARNHELAPLTFIIGPLLDSDYPLLLAYA